MVLWLQWLPSLSNGYMYTVSSPNEDEGPSYIALPCACRACELVTLSGARLVVTTICGCVHEILLLSNHCEILLEDSNVSLCMCPFLLQCLAEPIVHCVLILYQSNVWPRWVAGPSFYHVGIWSCVLWGMSEMYLPMRMWMPGCLLWPSRWLSDSPSR